MNEDRNRDNMVVIRDFIFNNEIQSFISKINDNIMEYNILEIIGMGTQEIKHSNILAWLFNNREHNLEYSVLNSFIKEVIKLNRTKNLKKLQEYLYLPNKKRDIIIYREKDNIDLLIVDKSNKIVIAIENKIYANERVDGKDGGQLKKYMDIVKKKYADYQSYFIFLTIDSEEPSKDIWLIANYQAIADSIKNILKTKEILSKTKIILESYIDLLQRRGIVENKELKELCEKIWLNKDYQNALEILSNYKITRLDIFYKKIIKEFEIDFVECEKNTINCIRTQASEVMIKEFTSDSSWDESEQFTIELQVNKYKDHIWFGYYHPNAEYLIKKYPKFKEIYKKLFKENKDIKKEHILVKITEDTILEDLRLIIEKEISRFEDVVNSVFNPS